MYCRGVNLFMTWQAQIINMLQVDSNYMNLCSNGVCVRAEIQFQVGYTCVLKLPVKVGIYELLKLITYTYK